MLHLILTYNRYYFFLVSKILVKERSLYTNNQPYGSLTIPTHPYKKYATNQTKLKLLLRIIISFFILNATSYKSEYI